MAELRPVERGLDGQEERSESGAAEAGRRRREEAADRTDDAEDRRGAEDESEPKKVDPPILANKDGDGHRRSETRLWHNDMPKIAQLMRRTDGIIVHGGWTGTFNGPGEYVKIRFDQRDDWILDGQAVPQLEGYVHCVTGMPAGWFDLERATDATWEQVARQPGTKPPVELHLRRTRESAGWQASAGT